MKRLGISVTYDFLQDRLLGQKRSRVHICLKLLASNFSQYYPTDKNNLGQKSFSMHRLLIIKILNEPLSWWAIEIEDKEQGQHEKIRVTKCVLYGQKQLC